MNDEARSLAKWHRMSVPSPLAAERKHWSETGSGSERGVPLSSLPIGATFVFRASDTEPKTKRTDSGWYTVESNGARFKTGRHVAVIREPGEAEPEYVRCECGAPMHPECEDCGGCPV